MLLKFRRHRLHLLFLILKTIQSGEARVKCHNKQREPCQWFGNCGVGNTIGCPLGYSLQEELSCMNDPNNSQYFCCKDGVNFANFKPRYLTPRDYSNANFFPHIETDDIPLPYSPRRHPTKNAVVRDNPWPGARAAYSLDTTFSDEDRAEVAKAIMNYHDNTCFRFYPKSDEDQNWISIEGDDTVDTGKNCGVSQLCGPLGGGQYSKFGGTCRNAEWMIHELGHAICFNHEQDRFDRDNFVYFNTSNPGCAASTKAKENEYTTSGLPFDFSSSQMYPGCRPGDCIQRKKGSGYCGNNWNGSGRLRPLDIQKINRYYNCCARDDKYSC